MKKISLKNHSVINEKWVQQKIEEDPTILNIGDVYLKDKERTQPRAGRLDLLLQDNETNRRYEVELQLGATDESHIIRTIEYWDIEKKRYPQYEHVAVLIAEDITSRFFNIISLFNGHIPLIAIQMDAFEIDGKIALHFTKVLDEMPLGLIDEDEETQIPSDRPYWEKKGSKETVKIADELLSYANEITNEKYNLKYNKPYIGIENGRIANNFITFRPKKKDLTLSVRLDKLSEYDEIIDKSE